MGYWLPLPLRLCRMNSGSDKTKSFEFWVRGVEFGCRVWEEQDQPQPTVEMQTFFS